MTKAEILVKLKSIGFPVAYREFDRPVSPPFITYLRAYEKKVASDSKTHGIWRTYNVELYTRGKDEISENKVEAVLNVIDPENESEETFIKSENMYQIIYQISVFEKFV